MRRELESSDGVDFHTHEGAGEANDDAEDDDVDDDEDEDGEAEAEEFTDGGNRGDKSVDDGDSVAEMSSLRLWPD